MMKLQVATFFLIRQLVTNLASEEKNLAYKKHVWQSRGQSHGDRTVDGIMTYDEDWSGCATSLSDTHHPEHYPWWLVDLGNVSTVSLVTVTPSEVTSGHGEGAVVLMTSESIDPSAPDFSLFRRCGTISGRERIQTMFVWCPPNEQARYVAVYLPKDYVELVLCEVQVFGRPGTDEDNYNLALGKVTNQSSTEADWSAEKAVDGNLRTNIKFGSCSSTKSEKKPWWRVDLGREYIIENVTITNRQRVPYFKWIDGAIITVGRVDQTDPVNYRNYELCGHIGYVRVKETKQINCQARPTGRYVHIGKHVGTGQHPLTLCEVQVFGFQLPQIRILQGIIYVFHHEKVDFKTSIKQCEGSQGDLLAVHDRGYTDKLSLITRELQKLGMTGTWVKLKDNMTGNTQKTGNCITLQSLSGIQDVSQCRHKMTFICESGPVVSLKYRDRILTAYIKPLQWMNANYTCVSAGTTLATFNAHDNIFLQTVHNRYNIKRIWTITTDKDRNMTSCSAMETYPVKTDNSDCEEKLPFICEISVTTFNHSEFTPAPIYKRYYSVQDILIAVLVTLVCLAIVILVVVIVLRRSRQRQANLKHLRVHYRPADRGVTINDSNPYTMSNENSRQRVKPPTVDNPCYSSSSHYMEPVSQTPNYYSYASFPQPRSGAQASVTGNDSTNQYEAIGKGADENEIYADIDEGNISKMGDDVYLTIPDTKNK